MDDPTTPSGRMMPQQQLPSQIYPPIPSPTPSSASSYVQPNLSGSVQNWQQYPGVQTSLCQQNSSYVDGGWGQPPPDEWGGGSGSIASAPRSPAPVHIPPSPLQQTFISQSATQMSIAAQPQQVLARVPSLRDDAPSHFICPITADIMSDPVFASDG